MKITHSTPDYDIERATKAELVEALLPETSLEPAKLRQLSKAELVDYAKGRRDGARQVKERADAEAEAARLAKLEAEKADPVVGAIIDAMTNGFGEHVKDAEDSLLKARTAIAAAIPFNVAYQISLHCEDVLNADGILREVAGMHNYLRAQVEDRTHTLDEIAKSLEHERQRLTDTCMNDDGYRHNSTCPVRNMENIARHKAKQYAARLFTDACRKLTEAREDVGLVVRLASISDRRYAW